MTDHNPRSPSSWPSPFRQRHEKRTNAQKYHLVDVRGTRPVCSCGTRFDPEASSVEAWVVATAHRNNPAVKPW